MHANRAKILIFLGRMEIGQIGFKDLSKVKKIHVAQRENAIVNRLNKTKVSHNDLKAWPSNGLSLMLIRSRAILT